jgi:hypothetical protein
VVGEVLRADGVGDAFFAEGRAGFAGLVVRDGGAVLLDGAADGRGDFFPRGVGKAYIQHAFVVVGGGLDGLVDGHQDIGFDEFSLAEDLDAGAVAVEDVAVLDELFELDLGHFHQAVDFILGPLEILDTEGVDGHVCDAGFVADLEDLEWFVSRFVQMGALCGSCAYPCQCLEAQIMSLDRLDAMCFGKSPVAVHDKGNMFGYRPLSQGSYEQLS